MRVVADIYKSFKKASELLSFYVQCITAHKTLPWFKIIPLYSGYMYTGQVHIILHIVQCAES